MWQGNQENDLADLLEKNRNNSLSSIYGPELMSEYSSNLCLIIYLLIIIAVSVMVDTKTSRE